MDLILSTQAFLANMLYTEADDTRGNFLSNVVAVNGQPGETQVPWPILII